MVLLGQGRNEEAGVKVSLFEQVPYRYLPDGFENQYSSAVTPPREL